MYNIYKPGFLVLLFFVCQFCTAQSIKKTDAPAKEDLTAENMLLWQRNVGGWPKDTYPKYYDDKNATADTKPGAKVIIDYRKEFTPEQKQLALDTKNFTDATIDNGHTTREISYLMQAYEKTQNLKYLSGAERGLEYLFKAQYDNGGWPQFYPDMRLYRHQITYNDNAMTNVMNLMKDITEKKNFTTPLFEKYSGKAQKAFDKGIDIILKTQLKKNGQLTAWCAQYDEKTLEPATARSYELPSLSGDESVEIARVLMRVDHPSKEVIKAVDAAISWFEDAEIRGYKVQRVRDSTMPKGFNTIVVPEDGGLMWARFYDLETNKPFFSDRDGKKKNTLAEIGDERRNGYAWYGQWPKELIEKEYPEWKMKHHL